MNSGTVAGGITSTFGLWNAYNSTANRYFSWRNGTAIYSNFSMSFARTATPRIGRGMNAANCYSGHIAEFIILHTIATPAERADIGLYFDREYAGNPF